MAGEEKQGDGQTPSPLDRIGDELMRLVSTGADRLVDAASSRLTDATQRITQSAGGGGVVPDLAAGVLSGKKPTAAAGGALRGVKDRVMGGGGKGGGQDGNGGNGGGSKESEAGNTKVTNIVETIDIGVPLRTVYDHWTQYEKFGVFTKGVANVDQSDEVTSQWKVKISFFERTFEATVEEQVPDDRIVWNSEGSQGTTRGAVSFHELTPTLTRVVAVVEYYPSGFIEKLGNIWRAQGRRLRLDLKHFQRYVTLAAEDVQGWRGEVRDGEVVRSHEDAVREEEQGENGEGEGNGETNGEDQGEGNGERGAEGNGNGNGNGGNGGGGNGQNGRKNGK
ncbi:SRPBCC family protein [Wenjunlia vitaminophila]|uniref:SRPBCC family protein n=1 Tax=Wenjunlia vitaminophila TaxID=76728 RepID=UPI00039A8322|nr:SRPBCC family protein [Wenjunlia vitaminophila]